MPLLHRSCFRFCLLLVLCSLISLPTLADLTIGGDAREVGMGGAGLASTNSAASSTLNPAFLADTGMRFSIEMPNINAGTQGIGYGDAFKLLMNPSLSASSAYSMFNGLTQPKSINASASTGLLLPQMDLQASAIVHTDASLNGSNGVDITSGGIMNLPSVGLGFHIPVDANRYGPLSVGVRMNLAQEYYSHYQITPLDPSQAKPATEMAGKDYLHQTSLSADLGMMYAPKSLPNAHLALVVDNLIAPRPIRFPLPTASGLTSQQIAPRTFNLGAAYDIRYLTFAADLVDFTHTPVARLGVELRTPYNLLALRGGYSSTTGYTAGIGIAGFGIAYSQHAPILASDSIVF